MTGVHAIVQAGRTLLKENAALSEAEFRHRIMHQMIADDAAAHPTDTHGLAGSGPAGAVLMVLVLPVFFFRWLTWRGKLRRYEADIDAAIRILRNEGLFAATPDQPTDR